MASASERNEVAVRFGENLQRLRRTARLSQERLSALAALHRTEIGLLERGERVPRVDTAVRLAAALSVTVSELVDGVGWELPTTSEGRFITRTKIDGEGPNEKLSS